MRTTLTDQEMRREQILNVVLEKRCSVEKAASLMEVSERQGWRLLAKYRQDGIIALKHGSWQDACQCDSPSHPGQGT